MLNSSELREILQIGIDLTTEKNRHHLLERMLNKAMEIMGCDAGTLYLCKNDTLEFKLMKTLSQGVSRGENNTPIDMPPVAMREENVCSYSAIHRELVLIPDVYTSEMFDFSGPKRYDGITGYRTKSMLVIPMVDAEDKVIGVLQLINKLDEDGNIITFTEEDAFILRSLGSMAAVSVSNMLYLDELKSQMHSFVQAFANAVDKRTPYNGSHTRKVTVYSMLAAKRLNYLYETGQGGEPFDDARREQLVLAAGLHDIGKMIVPTAVMNKSTRLDAGLERVRTRFEYLSVLYERDMLRGCITEEEYTGKTTELKEALDIILRADSAGFLQDELLHEIERIAELVYIGPEGERIDYLTATEVECLKVRKGTLTTKEREIMESHVSMTKAILEEAQFSSKYEKALQFAAEHHETLDGKGYPLGLRADEISTETRILTVADIYDALTCTDRPYKKPIPKERAFAILYQMAEEGKLDPVIIRVLEEALENMENDEIEFLSRKNNFLH